MDNSDSVVDAGHSTDQPDRGAPSVLLLGPVDLRRGDVSAPIPGAKVRAVLALLALANGHVVSAETLIDGVWGEDPPLTAANTLQYHVGVLRKALAAVGAPDAVTTRAPGYSLELATDVADFTALRRSADTAAEQRDFEAAASAYAAALRLWRGPALADLLVFPFAASKAVLLEQQRLACMEAWAQAELACDRADELVIALEELVSEHPTRERLWEHLMVALYRTGRQAEALSAFQRARDHLDEELGVEPGPGLRATHAAVLAQDAKLDAPRPSRPRAGRVLSVVPTRLRSSLAGGRAWLVTSDGRRLELGDAPVVLGRQSGCDLVIGDEEVSREHARLVPVGDGHAVVDLGSTNGTGVNGGRITAATVLRHGDRIEIGASVVRYEASAT